MFENCTFSQGSWYYTQADHAESSEHKYKSYINIKKVST